jgi:spore coat protein U-like protein
MFNRIASPQSLRVGLIAAAAAAIAVAAPASAQVANSTMTIGAVVTNNCIVTTTPVTFGDIDVTSAAARDITGGLDVTCTNGTGWTAAAGAGVNGGTVGARQMSSGADALDYALYTDATRTTLWGDGTDGTVAMTGTGTGTVQNEVIYASVLPGQQAVRAGTFADTINVTVTY